MPAPPAYLDECVDHDLVDALRARGFTVTSALEQGRANLGYPDGTQLVLASARDWVLMTHRFKSFWNRATYRLRGYGADEARLAMLTVPHVSR